MENNKFATEELKKEARAICDEISSTRASAFLHFYPDLDLAVVSIYDDGCRKGIKRTLELKCCSYKLNTQAFMAELKAHQIRLKALHSGAEA